MFIEVNNQALNVSYIHSITKSKVSSKFDDTFAIKYQLPFELVCEQFSNVDERDKKYNEIMLMTGVVK